MDVGYKTYMNVYTMKGEDKKMSHDWKKKEKKSSLKR